MRHFLQTKMVFKQSIKYLKNEKINLSKAILKPECLAYHNIYIFYFILLYTRRAIATQTNPKSVLIEKKNLRNTKASVGYSIMVLYILVSNSFLI